MAWTSRLATENLAPPTNTVRPSRAQRRLARWARRTATRTPASDPRARRREMLLPDRVRVAREDLLEIAALLESRHGAEPRATAALRTLLQDGCASPLYNRELHVSELKATLVYIKQALTAEDGRGSGRSAGHRLAPARERGRQLRA